MDKDHVSAGFTVRLLYRRRRDDQLVGVVESVEDGVCRTFVSCQELWAFLIRDVGSGVGHPDLNEVSDE